MKKIIFFAILLCASLAICLTAPITATATNSSNCSNHSLNSGASISVTDSDGISHTIKLRRATDSNALLEIDEEQYTLAKGDSTFITASLEVKLITAMGASGPEPSYATISICGNGSDTATEESTDPGEESADADSSSTEDDVTEIPTDTIGTEDSDKDEPDFDIGDFDISASFTIRELIEEGVGDNFIESSNISENPILKLFLPLGIKIIPPTDEPAFILQLSETGISTIDEDKYAHTPDLEAAIKLDGLEGGIEYLKPNTIVGCALASVFHREQGIPLKGTDTFKFKIVDFIVGIVYNFIDDTSKETSA